MTCSRVSFLPRYSSNPAVRICSPKGMTILFLLQLALVNDLAVHHHPKPKDTIYPEEHCAHRRRPLRPRPDTWLPSWERQNANHHTTVIKHQMRRNLGKDPTVCKVSPICGVITTIGVDLSDSVLALVIASFFSALGSA